MGAVSYHLFLSVYKNLFSFSSLCDRKGQKNSKLWNAIWEILTINNCAYFPANWKEVNVAVYVSFRICRLLLLFCFNKHFEGGSFHIFFLPSKKPPRRQRTVGKKKEGGEFSVKLTIFFFKLTAWSLYIHFGCDEWSFTALCLGIWAWQEHHILLEALSLKLRCPVDGILFRELTFVKVH